MTEPEVTTVAIAELALRLLALHGTAAYAVYVVAAQDTAEVLAELQEELAVLDDSLEVELVKPPHAEDLFRPRRAPFLLVDAGSFTESDWLLLDRRRSSLARPGVMLFVTSPEGLALLMHGVPNLTSWLAFVAQHADPRPALALAREGRLSALRAWANKTDHEVVHAALAGTLPTDPEYAEWLVLLGRGDLLSPDSGPR